MIRFLAIFAVVAGVMGLLNLYLGPVPVGFWLLALALAAGMLAVVLHDSAREQGR